MNAVVRRAYRLDRPTADLSSTRLSMIVSIALLAFSAAMAFRTPPLNGVTVAVLVLFVVGEAFTIPGLVLMTRELRKRARLGAAASDLPS